MKLLELPISRCALSRRTKSQIVSILCGNKESPCLENSTSLTMQKIESQCFENSTHPTHRFETETMKWIVWQHLAKMEMPGRHWKIWSWCSCNLLDIFLKIKTKKHKLHIIYLRECHNFQWRRKTTPMQESYRNNIFPAMYLHQDIFISRTQQYISISCGQLYIFIGGDQYMFSSHFSKTLFLEALQR